ncbi:MULTISPECIES: hypothetical protein [unclassified Shewanella]|uniref:hypothetical protein n=1 Tax=unclassified Shewanella TaxID=196818 RepID=UPI000C837D52|nr:MULTISPECIES: hypothetical protein [unclassified Shewanella]MDO6620759.1 hypothetical protein [Shewanella sp. 6_MG-2023]PMH88141.1 hypothetical protein BCU57_20110 [Shewanella sp. 10N.286.48.B5]
MKKRLTVFAMSLFLMACNSDNGDKGIVGGIDVDKATSIKMTNFKFSSQDYTSTFQLENEEGEMVTGARDYKVMILGDGTTSGASAFDIPWHYAELYQCGVVPEHECRGELKEISAGHYTFDTVTLPEFDGKNARIRVSVSIVGLLSQTKPRLY